MILYTLLQGLALLYGFLDFLLNFNDPGLVVFTSGLLLGHLLLGLGDRLLKSLDFGHRSSVIFQFLFYLAELLLSPLQTLLQSGDLRSMRGCSH